MVVGLVVRSVGQTNGNLYILTTDMPILPLLCSLTLPTKHHPVDGVWTLNVSSSDYVSFVGRFSLYQSFSLYSLHLTPVWVVVAVVHRFSLRYRIQKRSSSVAYAA